MKKTATKEQVKTALHQELFKRGELSWMLHSSQLEVKQAIDVLLPSVREVVVLISRRWGKSYLGAVCAIETCLRKPGAHVLIVAPSKVHAASIVIPLLKEISSQAPVGLLKHRKSDFQWEFSNGSRITLGGFDTATESFRGQRADQIFLEESGLAAPDTYDYVLKSVLLPTLLHSNGRIIHLTTPAHMPDHPLHLVTIPKCEALGSLFVKDIYSNPLITEEQIAELMKEMGGASSIDWRRECLCEIVRDASTAVAPSFDRAKHVQEMQQVERKWTVSIDFGGTRDKSVCLFGWFLFSQKKLVVERELSWEPNTSTETMVTEIRRSLLDLSIDESSIRIWADAPGLTLVDLFQTHKFNAHLPQKSERDVAIDRLNIAFSTDSISINPSCSLLISTLASAQFNARRTDFERSKALGHADALMALVYLYRMVDRSNPNPFILDASKQWGSAYLRQSEVANGLAAWSGKVKKRQPNKGKIA